jgi:CheY-like chemotaxis protein
MTLKPADSPNGDDTAPDGNPEPTGRVMLVDDQPMNLKLMEEMLRRTGHRVVSFSGGRLALAAARQDPPDLILLDISMPEMSGFEVCEQLKADPKLAHIPVIFLSALADTKDKVKAFRCGGVDYVTKPVQLEEIRARVKVQIQLQLARKAERDLLEKTLTGAVRSMAEMIHLTVPYLSERSEAILRLVRHMVARSGEKETWQYELAATLCLTGCVALPPDAFERAYAGKGASRAEREMFLAHPQLAARLLSTIPRLEGVAEMILQQFTDAVDYRRGSPTELGARMLRIAVELDRRMCLRATFPEALSQLKATEGKYCRDLLDLLDDYEPATRDFDTRHIRVNELRPLMVLDDDLVTTDGTMILQRETTLNLTFIERVRNFAATRGAREPIRVRIMRTT